MSHLIRAAVVAGAAVLATPALADPILTVTGHGTATVTAVDARINGTVDSKGPTTAEAIAAGRNATANILTALKRLGVPEKDFTITGLNINPQYATGPITPGQPRTVTGYNCNTTILVTVEHSEQLTDILQTLALAGVNQSQRVTYLAHDSEAALAEARAAAVKDAFARGKILAGQTGVTLGPVVSVTDGTPTGLVNYAEQFLSILNAQNANRTVIATVTVGWAIK